MLCKIDKPSIIIIIISAKRLQLLLPSAHPRRTTRCCQAWQLLTGSLDAGMFWEGSIDLTP